MRLKKRIVQQNLYTLKNKIKLLIKTKPGGKMNYPKFLSFNVIGGLAWVSLFVFAGYFFGGIQIIKDHLTSVIFIIIFISILPPVIEFIRGKYEKRR